MDWPAHAFDDTDALHGLTETMACAALRAQRGRHGRAAAAGALQNGGTGRWSRRTRRRLAFRAGRGGPCVVLREEGSGRVVRLPFG